MLAKILPWLRFFRLVDDQDRLSLTNIVLLVAVWNLIHCPAVGVTDVAGLLGSVASYQFKRYLTPTANDGADETAALRADMESMKTKMSGLQLGSQMRRQ